jgi:hypothetical protein
MALVGYAAAVPERDPADDPTHRRASIGGSDESRARSRGRSGLDALIGAVIGLGANGLTVVAATTLPDRGAEGFTALGQFVAILFFGSALVVITSLVAGIWLIRKSRVAFGIALMIGACSPIVFGLLVELIGR